MDLTWVAAASFLLVGVGYAFVQQSRRFRVVCWVLLCASLFALSTRDLFRTRERGPPARTTNDARSEDDAPTKDGETERPGDRTRRPNESRTRRGDSADRPAATSDAGDERERPPLAARVRGRVAGWFG
jgi:hypothetical protein